MKRQRLIIMGAAGRDFHNFNVCYRDSDAYDVKAFTAAQIPYIETRTYPRELAGHLYPEGIPIYPEDTLGALIPEYGIDQVVFAYSDVSHEYVMHKASLCISLGADFVLLGAEKTMIESALPVISVCAVRTGCGKSEVTRYVLRILREKGLKPAAIRHPMPYCDLARERVQRFEKPGDLDSQNCTIEEREEYEPLIAEGAVVYAGVDYQEIVKSVEKEAEIIVWDGGNNDLPFVRPDLETVVLDPHRAGHEMLYHPGEANMRRADVAIINKVDTADRESVAIVEQNVRSVNAQAVIVRTASRISTDDPEGIKGRKVLVVEDGPTLTHGGMSYGAGLLAARQFHAAEVVDPRPYAVGSIKETFRRYAHIGDLLPATGYAPEQIEELRKTIESVPCDVVLVATPVDLGSLLHISRKVVRVSYGIEEVEGNEFRACIEGFVDSLDQGAPGKALKR
ncbi:MAG: cyclic 2,3-diphosphoglycerate synthase [Candidatus Sulfobium sp.]|jgi:predicted GTPase